MTTFLILAIAGLAVSVEGKAPNAVDLSFPKVVSQYYPIIDGDKESLVRILAETGTEMVFHAYYAIPGATGHDHGRPSLIASTIGYVKDRMPWVVFEGAIDAYDYCTANPDLSAVYAEAVKQYKEGFSGCYPLDPIKAKAQQLIINVAMSLIDAGVDLLHFDLIDGVPAFYHLDMEPYIAAWKQIASAVKDYAHNKYGKDVEVSINNSIGQGYVWPYQDYLALGLAGVEGAGMIQTQNMRVNWIGEKAQIVNVYGWLPPLLFFLDYGSPEHETPMTALASLSRERQIAVLDMLHAMALAQKVMFVYPLHGGRICVDPSCDLQYDAIEQGTYDAIKELTNNISSVHTMTVTATSTETLRTTVTENSTIAMLGQGTVADPLIFSAVVLGIAIVLVALILRRGKLPS